LWLVKANNWRSPQFRKCGLSLTDVCGAPPGMSDATWLAWKQSVRTDSNCAGLLTQLENCCAERSNQPASPGENYDELRLIPYPDFKRTLDQCLSEEKWFNPAAQNPWAESRTDKERALCDRMMFSQTAVRDFRLWLGEWQPLPGRRRLLRARGLLLADVHPELAGLVPRY
jgi:hypothetical protein